MGASLIHTLISATVASSLGALVVGPLRRPLRVLAGARASYWLWLVIPAMVLATLLPVPSGVVQVSSKSLTAQLGSALSGVVLPPGPQRTLSMFAVTGLALWAAGAAVMLGLLIHRQRSFLRSLGTLSPDSDDMPRSAAIIAPMVVGALRSRLILPVDFESRYSEAEREFMLAHERAHLLRHDVFVNAVAAAWLCVFWFNPLMYWAIARLRLDQELACDAVALTRTGAARQCYADALLRTQLAGESGWQMPIGCRWQSGHPLKERLAMLKRRTPGLLPRLGGLAFILAVTSSASYEVWAVQSVPEGDGTQVFVGISIMTWTPHLPSSNPPQTDVREFTMARIVHSGEATPTAQPQEPFNVICTPFLPMEVGQSSRQVDSGTRAIPAAAEGQIVVQCKITHNGEVVATPTLVALDAQPTSVKIDDKGRALHYQLVVTASTSKTRFEAAAKAHDAMTSTNNK